MKKTLLRLGVLALSFSVGFGAINAMAQSDPTGKRRITDSYAIKDAMVITAPGQEARTATILMNNGVITGIGSNVTISVGTKVIEGDSLYIYPGFIAGASDAGITKPEDPERPENFVSSNPPDEIAGITPWRSAVDQFNPSDRSVEDLRKIGFTIIQAQPDGGMLSGKSALMLLGHDQNSNLLKENTALAASFRGSRGMYPSTAAGVMAKFRDVYKNAELTESQMAQFSNNLGARRPEITDTYKGMQDVISGEVPVLFSASSELEILRVLKLQRELGFKLILTDLENYEEVIPQIKASGAGVLIKLEVPDDKASEKELDEDATEAAKEQLKRVKEAYQKYLAQASKLEAEGIPFAFSLADVKPNDAQEAIQKMMEAGLSENGAMAALTTQPAQMLGISRIAGTLAEGKMANMVIATGPIFEEDSQIKHVVVDGYVFDYDTKQKKSNGEAPAEGIAIAGVWDYETESPAGSGEGTITITRASDGYEGTITYDDPSGSGKASAPISNIELSGSTLSFSFSVDAQGMSIDIEVSGDITGNTMEGTMALGQFGSFPLSATLNPSFISRK
ncbi:amidohydrolase family protein [Algoriphagus sediminis]|uniref:Amidohydrolase family protein n=1 Tax=Algoriphagus sediminis TaxID=3057113 RepID=A0ABT7YDH0_9BACT|nr:amidohydrolase family protein [Algoriphagus sediminis]MDN3204556.1 amidohydrolase family protein [Algoriphagus sediminis]